jgi:hypothetical protein
MMTIRCAACVLVCCLVALAAPSPALAQGRGGGNNPKLDLTISPLSISFASANPDTTPVVAAAPVVVTIRVRQNDGPWTLTVLANGDLLSGPSSVDIANVTWTATPAPPFQGGTLSKTVAQRVASGTGTVNPAQNGSLTFRRANALTYNAANYTQTLVFTLTAP